MRQACAMALAVLAVGACGGEPSGEQGGHVPFKLTATRGDFLFEWVEPSGEFRTGTRVDQVPPPCRAKVRVEPLSLPPERRAPSDHVYVADLRRPDRAGVYPVEIVPREAFEALSKVVMAPLPPLRPPSAGDGSGSAPAPSGPAPSGAVVVYGASWCGACRQAEQWLRAHGVPFVEKDIERDPGARQEMEAKCRAAGVQPSGIPVIDVGGQIVQGFSAGRLGRLLGK